MSTKIYDGMRALSPNVFEVQQRIRATLDPIFYRHLFAAAKLAHTAANAGTNVTWTQAFDLSPHNPIYSAWRGAIPVMSKSWYVSQVHALMLALKSDPHHTFSNLDVGYDVVLLPDGRNSAMNALAVLYSERAGDEYREALVQQKVVEKFPFWDNTDPPDDVSDEEWEERRRAWSRVDVPAEIGLYISQPDAYSTAIEADKKGRTT